MSPSVVSVVSINRVKMVAQRDGNLYREGSPLARKHEPEGH